MFPLFNPTLVYPSTRARRAIIENYPLPPGHCLVEVTQTWITDTATQTTTQRGIDRPSDSTVIAKAPIILRKALFSDGAETRVKEIWDVTQLRTIERETFVSPAGTTQTTRPINLFVVKRAS